MSINTKWLVFTLALALIFVGSLWIFGDVFQPFIIGFILAYLLSPIAVKLQGLGFSRSFACFIIILFSFLLLLLLAFLIFPVLLQQLAKLVALLPDLLESSLRFVKLYAPDFFRERIFLDDALASFQAEVRNQILPIIDGLVQSSVIVFSFAVNLLVAVVLAFYFLIDWNRIIEKISLLIPKKYRGPVDSICSEVDSVLASFIRGQLSVCIILSALYSVSLLTIGLESAIALGVFAGMISFIPFIGALFGGGLAMLIAISQFWFNPIYLALVGLTFLLGQLLEGNYLTPKLVGKAVGLHPVWLIFSLSVFASLAGISGLLIAVPTAAVVGVLLRHLTRSYLTSNFYQN